MLPKTGAEAGYRPKELKPNESAGSLRPGGLSPDGREWPRKDLFWFKNRREQELLPTLLQYGGR